LVALWRCVHKLGQPSLCRHFIKWVWL